MWGPLVSGSSCEVWLEATQFYVRKYVATHCVAAAFTAAIIGFFEWVVILWYGTTTGPTVLASFLLIGLVGRDLYS